MDLYPSAEHEQLIDTVRAFVERSLDTTSVRQVEGGEPGYDRGAWSTMVELGWSELPPLELALVADGLGRGPLCSPLPVTAALRNALPELAADLALDAVVTLAVLAPDQRDEWTPPAPTTGTEPDSTFVLVPFAASADRIVVATPNGLGVVDPARLERPPTRHDAVGGDPLYRVEIGTATPEPLSGDLTRVLDHLAVSALAATVGAAEGALTLAVQHAKDRHQFGRPIGSFQAVAHRCADMRADVDACRVLALRAAWALAGESDSTRAPVDVEFAVASALAYAKDALRRVAMHAHQVLGAIGFSTEHDLQLFTRRIKAFELAYGSTAFHRQRLAAAIGLD